MTDSTIARTGTVHKAGCISAPGSISIPPLRFALSSLFSLLYLPSLLPCSPSFIIPPRSPTPASGLHVSCPYDRDGDVSGDLSVARAVNERNLHSWITLSRCRRLIAREDARGESYREERKLKDGGGWLVG